MDTSFMSSFTGNFVIGIIIILVIFLLFCWVNLWYWKINEIVNLLKEIRDNQKKKTEELEK